MSDINLTYYKPINKAQTQFHASKATHKLMMGGFGSGKTYPSLHESIFHCLDNPGHNYYMFKNTWDFVEEHLETDTRRICDDCVLTLSWSKEKHELTLINKCKIRFRPLTLGKAKFKGINCCGFFIDDPDVNRYSELISFLFSRLRDTPYAKANRFQTIITANLEGRDWLWNTYMRKEDGTEREQGGDEKFAYWICPTSENKTLPASFISDLAEVHTKEWMDRYVYCKMDSFIGRIYHNFDRFVHHMDSKEMYKKTIFHRTLALDVGITHASVYLEMFTDGEAIYVAKEYYEKGVSANQLGANIVDARKKKLYQSMVIDPSSNKTEQTSGTSVKQLLWDNYRLSFIGANNDVDYGIQIVQDLLKPVVGKPRLYIDTKECPMLTVEMEIYRWEEPKDLDTDYMEYKQKPVKKRDDTVDALRYGVCHLKRHLSKKHEDIQQLLDEDKALRWANRFNNLKMYKDNPALVEKHIAKLGGSVEKSMYERMGYPELGKKINKRGKTLISGLL